MHAKHARYQLRHSPIVATRADSCTYKPPKPSHPATGVAGGVGRGRTGLRAGRKGERLHMSRLMGREGEKASAQGKGAREKKKSLAPWPFALSCLPQCQPPFVVLSVRHRDASADGSRERMRRRKETKREEGEKKTHSPSAFALLLFRPFSFSSPLSPVHSVSSTSKKKETQKNGAAGLRSRYLVHAKHARYQLRHSPIVATRCHSTAYEQLTSLLCPALPSCHWRSLGRRVGLLHEAPEANEFII